MILVTGATGHIGRELVRELDERGVTFRILVRDPQRAADLPARAERVVGDLDDPSSLAPAFAGVDKLFLLTQGIDTARTAHALAAATKVRHIVSLSSFHVVMDPLPAMGRWHYEREEMVKASGIPATFLRPGGFTTNALDWLPTIREGGYVLDPVSPGRYAPIDPADIAAVAALVLTEDGHQGQAYVLTGEEMLSVPEQVAMLSGATGLDLNVRVPAAPDEIVRARFPRGAPPALADAITQGFASMRRGGAELRTDTVERLLGRKPRGFADWCARNAAAFLG